MPADDVTIKIGAKDNASKVIDPLQKKTDKLEKPVELKIDAKLGKVFGQLDAVEDRARKSKEAAEALTRALGPELAAKSDVDKLVTQFRRMGLTIDEVIENADQLGDKLKQIDRMKVDVDVDIDKKKTFTSKIDGLIGKSKLGQVALDNLGGSVAGLGPAAFAAAGAAIGKFALSAANSFADLGVSIHKFGAISGASAEEASRWVAVADDYGVSADQLSGAIGKLGKGLGTNQALLEQYGVTVAKTANGNVDLTETTFNVIDAYNAIEDPTRKAALAQTAFGKSWQELIPLIEQGSSSIRDNLKGVSGSQIMSAKQQKQAQDFKLAMDSLSDALLDFKLNVGNQVVPVVEDLIGQVTTLTDVFNKLGDIVPGASLERVFRGLMDMNPINFLRDLRRNYRDLQDAFATPTAAPMFLNNLATGIKSAADAISKFDPKVVQMAVNAKEAEQATAEFAISQGRLGEATDKANDELSDLVDLLGDEIEAAQNAADLGLNLEKAQENLAKAHAETAAAQTEHGKTSEEYAAAIDNERDAVIAAGKVQRDYQEQQATANGAVISATQKIDDLNESLEEQAKTATPAAKKEIYDYLIQLNNIPAEQVTLITAAVAKGDYDTANKLLTELSATRTAAVTVDLDTTAAYRKLKQLQTFITSNFGNIEGPLPILDAGGTAGGLGGIAGERGPEILNSRYLTSGPTYIPPGTRVTSRRRTQQILMTRGTRGLKRYDAGGVVPRATSVTINAAVIGSTFDVMHAVSDAVRRADRLLPRHQ